jgi:hypothetical protein
MTPATVIRWWPVVGLLAMVVLGLVVGGGSTAVDDGFHDTYYAHPWLGRLLFVTDPRTQFTLWLIVVAVAALRRRWRLVAVVVLAPVVGVTAARLAKRVFGRHRDDALAYPSGHTTLLVVVLGMAVLVVGAAAWSVALATAVGVVGALGQGFTYHYFTDTVGAVFLGTAVVCLAWRLAGLDRCQPRCDLRHSEG